MRDMAHNLQIKRVISPVVVADDTPAVGQIIDRLGYDSLTYVIATGTLADANATFAVLLEESDAANMAGSNTVADADMISQTAGAAPEAAAGFQFDDDDEVRKLGYIGNKRYSRLTITPTGNGGNAPIAAIAVLGHPHVAPVTQASA